MLEKLLLGMKEPAGTYTLTEKESGRWCTPNPESRLIRRDRIVSMAARWGKENNYATVIVKLADQRTCSIIDVETNL